MRAPRAGAGGGGDPQHAAASIRALVVRRVLCGGFVVVFLTQLRSGPAQIAEVLLSTALDLCVPVSGSPLHLDYSAVLLPGDSPPCFWVRVCQKRGAGRPLPFRLSLTPCRRGVMLGRTSGCQGGPDRQHWDREQSQIRGRGQGGGGWHDHQWTFPPLSLS